MTDSAPGWIAPEVFSAACATLPLVSLDLVLVNAQRQMLLGRRVNAPARGWWFTPGGRIRKHEAWRQALQRVAAQELGLDPSLLSGLRSMGVWDHFYEDSAFSDVVSTHYVNLPFALLLPQGLALDGLPKDQHSAWTWRDAAEAAECPEVHAYVRPYARWLLAQGHQEADGFTWKQAVLSGDDLESRAAGAERT